MPFSHAWWRYQYPFYFVGLFWRLNKLFYEVLSLVPDTWHHTWQLNNVYWNHLYQSSKDIFLCYVIIDLHSCSGFQLWFLPKCYETALFLHDKSYYDLIIMGSNLRLFIFVAHERWYIPYLEGTFDLILNIIFLPKDPCNQTCPIEEYKYIYNISKQI